METILTQFDTLYAASPVALTAVGLIILYGVVSVLLLSYLLFNRGRLRHQEWRDQRLIATYEDQLFEILIGEQKRTDPRAYHFAVDRLRFAFAGSAVQALQREMVLLGRDLSGENLALLHELYQDLRMDQRAMYQLRYGTWHQKITAVKELGHFRVTHALPYLTDLSEDAHATLRGEAQCTLLRLGGVTYLNFLATVAQPLTRWQQIRLMNVLKRFPQDQLPNFQIYLSNPNESVTLFVLELIRVYNQTQEREAVIEKLFDERVSVQREAVRTVSGWLDQETVSLLLAMCDKGALPLHRSVVRALRQWTYDASTQTFLEDVAEHTEDYTLRMDALCSLKQLGGHQAIGALINTPDEAVQRCVVHQLDERI